MRYRAISIDNVMSELRISEATNRDVYWLDRHNRDMGCVALLTMAKVNRV